MQRTLLLLAALAACGTTTPGGADLGALPPTSYARAVFVGGNEPGAYGALRNDPDACDLYRWARVMPAARGTYRFAGN